MEIKDAPKKELPKMLYTVPEVARILMVTPDWVSKLIKKGYLTGLQLGRLKVTHKELENFLEKYNGLNFSDFDNVKPLQITDTKITH